MTPATSLPIAIPDDVHDFCAAHKLLADLKLAIQIAEETFAPIERWELSLQEDPEVENETYVILDIWLPTESIEEAMRADELFIHRWARAATSEGNFRITVLWHVR